MLQIIFKAIKPLIATAMTVNVKTVLPKFGHDAIHGADVGTFDNVQGGELTTLRQQIQNTPKAFALFNAGGVHDQNGMSSSNCTARRGCSWRSSCGFGSLR